MMALLSGNDQLVWPSGLDLSNFSFFACGPTNGTVAMGAGDGHWTFGGRPRFFLGNGLVK
jgi:hypothetical protein